MTKKILLCITTLICASVSGFCQEKKDPNFIQYVVQPEVEIGKTTDDTIAISVYEYSRFITITRKKHKAKKGSLTGKDSEIRISGETTLDDIAGIKGFEDYVAKNFELVDFDWDAMGNRKSIENINGTSYVKTKIFTAGLVPKNKGEFKIEPSEFEYEVYKSNTDYFSKFEPQDNGRYKVTDKGAKQLQVKSQAIEFKVK